MDEMEQYRERIERRYGERRLKNYRRTKKVKFWDVGTVINSILLTIAAVILYYAKRLCGGDNG